VALQMLPGLVDALDDSDSGVAAAAAAALATLAGGPSAADTIAAAAAGLDDLSIDPSRARPMLAPTLALLPPLAAHETSEVRLRAYALAASIAGRSTAAASAVAASGIMDALLREVDNTGKASRYRPVTIYRLLRQALTLCPQLSMSIQPGACFPARIADALSATQYGHFTWAIYRNRPITLL